jgi:hypothetical protein
MLRRVGLLFLGAMLCSAAWGQSQPDRPKDSAGETSAASPRKSSLEFRISPIVDLHLWLRAELGRRAADEPWDKLGELEVGPAASALRRLQAALGGLRGWLLFEGNFSGVQTAAEFLAVAEELPEEFRGQALREPAVGYARALVELEPRFLKSVWPERLQRLTAAEEALRRELGPHEAACLQQILRSLEMRDPGVVIPVYLTVDGPDPGASTSATLDERGVCFVSISMARGSQLVEAVLHESIHALDIATRGQPHVLNELRGQLVEAGISRLDRRWRDAWHTIMFLEAASAVRSLVSPGHEDYGDVAEYYAKVADIAAIERPIWQAYRGGEMSRAEAISRIVAGVVAIKPAESAVK